MRGMRSDFKPNFAISNRIIASYPAPLPIPANPKSRRIQPESVAALNRNRCPE
jgi:hypothetical protein